MRIVIDAVLGAGNADLLEEIKSAFARGGGIEIEMRLDRLDELAADRIERVEAGAGGRLSMRLPSNRMRPPAMWPGGSSRPMMAAPVSDLPAPDSPTTPSTSPSPMAKEMPSTAITVPRRVAKATRRSSTCRSGR